MNQQGTTAFSVAIRAAISFSLLSPSIVIAQTTDSRVLGVTQTTGSHIRQIDVETAAPVDVLDLEYIQSTGAMSVGEVIQNLPAIMGNALSTRISNGGDGTANATMRGLPASNVLVLIDGRRATNFGNAGSYVDLNTIPLSAVYRIEVLKDGASAIYGSDAIAGVINVITRKEYDGVEGQLYYGATSRGDGNTGDVTLMVGKDYEKGNFVLTGELYNQDEIWSRDRDISRDADTTADGEEFGVFQRSSAPPSSFIFHPTRGPLTLKDGLSQGRSPSDYRAFNDNTDRYNFREETVSLVPSKRGSVFFTGDYDLSPSLNVFTQAWYINTESESTSASTPLFAAFENRPIPVSANNPYNPFGIQIDDIRRRFLELGPRVEDINADNTRVVVGLEGNSINFDWDLSYTWHKDERETDNSGGMNLTRLISALGDPAVAPPGTVPLNLFGDGRQNSITQDQLDYVATTTTTTGESSLKDLLFNASTLTPWELQGGAVGLAFGLEYREEAGEYNPDPQVAAGDTVGFTNFEPTRGDRDVKEAYIEAIFPLLGDVPGAQELNLQLAARYSDYSDFGTNTSPKAGATWRINEQVMLRSTYSEGFRAPSIDELYLGQEESFDILADPLQPPTDTRTQFRTVTGGNPDLEPETSDSFTAGLVLQPAALEGFSMTLDYYRIDQENVVDSNPQFILDENARSGAFADRVVRNAKGELEVLNASLINIGARQVRGTDFSFNYNLPTEKAGTWRFALAGTYLDSWREQRLPNQPFEERKGTYIDDSQDGPGGLPEWKGFFSTLWDLNNWSASYRINYVDSYTEISTLDLIFTGEEREHTIDSFVTHDVQGSYTFAGDLRVSLGIDNLWDEMPSRSFEAFNDGYDGHNSNLAGRFLYARVKKSWN